MKTSLCENTHTSHQTSTSVVNRRYDKVNNISNVHGKRIQDINAIFYQSDQKTFEQLGILRKTVTKIFCHGFP